MKRTVTLSCGHRAKLADHFAQVGRHLWCRTCDPLGTSTTWDRVIVAVEGGQTPVRKFSKPAPTAKEGRP